MFRQCWNASVDITAAGAPRALPAQRGMHLTGERTCSVLPHSASVVWRWPRALLAGVAVVSDASAMSRKDKRTLVGAVVGGVAGNLLSNGDPAATVGGAVAGGAIGNLTTSDRRDRRYYDNRRYDNRYDRRYDRGYYRSGYYDRGDDRRWQRERYYDNRYYHDRGRHRGW